VRKLEVNSTDTVIAGPIQWEEPIRAETFGIERLEQHAESLAAAQRTTDEPSRGRNLLPKVRESSRVLLAAYRNIAETVREKGEITPAAEWLLDNFHIVEEQIREIRDHLPGSYYRRLPKIAAGHLAGYPRVYGLAWAYVAHRAGAFAHGEDQGMRQSDHVLVDGLQARALGSEKMEGAERCEAPRRRHHRRRVRGRSQETCRLIKSVIHNS
jgi:hypothetical protein